MILEPLTWQARDAVKLWLASADIYPGDGEDLAIQLREPLAARLLEQFSTNWR